jgi:isopenicillin N synthase-like dioxygenase
MSLIGQIPTLHLKHLYSRPKEFIPKLRQVCHEVGMFLLLHDIPIGTCGFLLRYARDYFNDPIQAKRSRSVEHYSTFRGYQKIYVPMEERKPYLREQFTLATEYDESECTNAHWPPYQRLKGTTNPWPKLQPKLKQTAMYYIPEMERIAHDLQQALIMALGLPKDAADAFFQPKPHWNMKFVNYSASLEPETVGFPEHTDDSFVTLTLQDGIPSVQVNHNKQWLHIDAAAKSGYLINLPGVIERRQVLTVKRSLLICNLGKQAEILSNGYYVATPHRTLIRSSLNRICVPFHYNAALESVLEPLIDETCGFSWDRWEHGASTWLSSSSNSQKISLPVGEMLFQKHAETCPEVMARHHSDLQVENGVVVMREHDAASC